MATEAELRSQLDRLRARDRELSALMSSLRELGEVRDVQPLLQKLVDRAHELMGADVTYLSEYDERTDELFVRANRGAVSTNMRELRVPAGVGLASKVVQSRSAQWTAAYDVASFPRDDAVSAAVEAEHMRSILGVPLIASDKVLGVLFAADRSTHGFSADRIALLTAFADQGAVILQTASLLAAERNAAQRAAVATAEAERRATAMEASAAMHHELTQLVLAGEGSAAVASALSASLGRPVAVADRDLVLLASSGDDATQWWVDGTLTAPVLAALEVSRGTARWVGLTAPASGGVVAAMAGRTLLGALLISGDDVDDLQQRTVERAAQIHALITMQRDAVSDAEERVSGEMVADLISGRGEVAALRARAAQRGVDLSGRLVPVVIAGGEQRWSLTRILAGIDPGWLVAQHDAGAVALVPGLPEPGELAEQIHRRLAGASLRTLVVVGAASEVGAIPSVVGELVALATMLPGVGVTEGPVTAAAYAPYLALFGADGERAVAFARLTLAPLLAWDADHRSDLVGTLEAFLAHNSSVTRAATSLFVHPNTVKQRLERIAELLGPHWRSGEQHFRLSIAVRIHRMSESATQRR